MKEKSTRLAELDAQLNMEAKPEPEAVQEQEEKAEARPSVLEKLKRPLEPSTKSAEKRCYEEVR